MHCSVILRNRDIITSIQERNSTVHIQRKAEFFHFPYLIPCAVLMIGILTSDLRPKPSR
jgi:hypothetical protein